MNSASTAEETRTRARTRRAILGAAVQVMGPNRSASMSEVAREAGVARSTLQRYFPERADLVAALGDYAQEQTNEAAERARTTEGTAIEAFGRLVSELYELRTLIMLAFGDEDPTDPDQQADAEWEESSTADTVLLELIERGHEDGTIDPKITPLWAMQLLWAGLYAGWSYAAFGRVSGYEALTLTLYSLVKAVERR